MRRATTALAFCFALVLGWSVAAAPLDTLGNEASPRSIVAHPAPPDLATLLQGVNPPLVCHLAHSAVRDRQGSELALTLEGALERAADLPSTGQGATADTTVDQPAVGAQDADALTPADVMLMVAGLALASLSLLAMRS